MKYRFAQASLLAAVACAGCGDDDIALPEHQDPSDVMGDAACEKLKDGASCGSAAHCAAGKCLDDRCGDGVRTGHEACDDGNQEQGDGCDPACRQEGPGCGDGKLGSDEECDDGNWFNDDGCSNTCTANQCGNRRVDVAEECDDGNHIDEDDCSNMCLVVACRNGRIEPGEECDDGNAIDRGDGCTNACKLSVCGNGKVEKYETCDDGNTKDGDDCPKNCVNAVCGNGTLDFGEVCEGARIEVENGQGDRQGCNGDCSMVVEEDECEKCQNTICANYQGVNLVNGCFRTIDTQFGADPEQDPDFIQHCIDVINCALEHRCGFDDGQRGAACYCGSRSVDDCSNKGPADDAPCQAQWLASALTASNAEMQVRFSDSSYAAGWAYALLDCYGNTDFCAASCRAKTP